MKNLSTDLLKLLSVKRYLRKELVGWIKTTRGPCFKERNLLQNETSRPSFVIPRRYRCRSSHGFNIAQGQGERQRLNFGEDEQPVFKPKTAAILTKMTRYEYERKLCEGMSDTEFRDYLESKDSDYHGLLERHNNHYVALDIVKDELLKANIDVRVVQRFSLDQSVVDWADVVFTTGGDGTYLMAANKFINTSKPLIGVNTDPDRSEGNLCLPKSSYTAHQFGKALKRLLAGDFGWKWRQRIQVIMSGHHFNDDPIELHDQQLIFPEHRFTEHIAEDEQVRVLRSDRKRKNLYPVRTLPCLALNEVFVGESLSSRVSYYELSTDTSPKVKQKSSGVTICTGTGSSSWHFHINHLAQISVEKILGIANQVSGCNYPLADQNITEEITDTFNNSLRFDPSEELMAYTIRDPIKNGVFSVERTSGFAKSPHSALCIKRAVQSAITDYLALYAKAVSTAFLMQREALVLIQIRSRMWDACLVVDGGMSFKFNDGAVATFEIAENNALRTVTFD